MAGVTSNVRQAAARSTLELPFFIPQKEWFSIKEAAAVCGMGETFMEALFDAAVENGSGEIHGHRHNAATGERMTKRIPRVFLVTYLGRTATYTNEALADALIACLRPLSRELLLRVASTAKKYAEEKPL